jgi:hypothetical protein
MNKRKQGRAVIELTDEQLKHTAGGTSYYGDLDDNKFLTQQYLPADADALQTLPLDSGVVETEFVHENLDAETMAAYEGVALGAAPVNVVTLDAASLDAAPLDDAPLAVEATPLLPIADANDVAESPNLDLHDVENKLNDLVASFQDGASEAGVEAQYADMIASFEATVEATKADLNAAQAVATTNALNALKKS